MKSQQTHSNRLYCCAGLHLYRAGADACLEKPVDIPICAAQARALIRLYFDGDNRHEHHSTISFGSELIISPRYRQVMVDGKNLELTRKEFDLLHCLASCPRQVFSLEHLGAGEPEVPRLAAMLGTTYKTAWSMLRRIHIAMGRRDEAHQLCGVIEFDDAYFGGPTTGKKRGRGTEKTKVFAALSLDEQGNPRFLKMRVTPNIKQASVRKFAHAAFANGSEIYSDGYCS